MGALRAARYLDADETVEFGEVHVFVGPDFVITVRRAGIPELSSVRQRLEADPELLGLGPPAVLYGILDEVVDQYVPVVAGLENDIDEIEDQIFSGHRDVSRRIYQLSREVIGFQHAAHPLEAILSTLQDRPDEGAGEELQRRLRDVQDHVLRIIDRVDAFRTLLHNALMLQATLVAQRQNEEVKRISAWAAILFAPTLVGTVYGMNFDHMPELPWPAGCALPSSRGRYS